MVPRLRMRIKPERTLHLVGVLIAMLTLGGCAGRYSSRVLDGTEAPHIVGEVEVGTVLVGTPLTYAGYLAKTCEVSSWRKPWRESQKEDLVLPERSTIQQECQVRPQSLGVICSGVRCVIARNDTDTTVVASEPGALVVDVVLPNGNQGLRRRFSYAVVEAASTDFTWRTPGGCPAEMHNYTDLPAGVSLTSQGRAVVFDRTQRVEACIRKTDQPELPASCVNPPMSSGWFPELQRYVDANGYGLYELSVRFADKTLACATTYGPPPAVSSRGGATE